MSSAHAKSKESKRSETVKHNKIKPLYAYSSYDIMPPVFFDSVIKAANVYSFWKTIYYPTFFFWVHRIFPGLYLAIRVRWSSWICKVGSEMAVA